MKHAHEYWKKNQLPSLIYLLNSILILFWLFAGRKMWIADKICWPWKCCQCRFESRFPRSLWESIDSSIETESTGNGCADEIHRFQSIRSVGQFAWWCRCGQLSIRQFDVSVPVQKLSHPSKFYSIFILLWVAASTKNAVTTVQHPMMLCSSIWRPLIHKIIQQCGPEIIATKLSPTALRTVLIGMN